MPHAPSTGDDILENDEKVIRICRTATGASQHPIIVKLSFAQSYLLIAKELESDVGAFHAINVVPWNIVFPNRKSPLEKLGGGGLSGPIIRPYVRQVTRELHKTVATPIIAGGGICNLNDLVELQNCGASAFSIGTLFLLRPWLPTRLVSLWYQGAT